MDHDRLPIVSGRRRRPIALAIVAAVVVGSGCVAPGPAPTDPPSGTPLATARPTGTGGSTSAATPSPSPAPATPVIDPLPIELPLASFTIVCESWDAEPPPDAIECDDAAELALASIGADGAGRVVRLDVAFGAPCAGTAPCARRADARRVVARSATFETLSVQVDRDDAGHLRVWPPVGEAMIPPAPFSAPAPRAPDVGPDAPAELRDRVALAFCGTEEISTPDEFATQSRRCFLDGVAGWTPVELISVDATGESGVVTTILRYDGRGGIARFVRSADAWSAARCAITPIDTIAVFVITSPCGRLDPRP